MIVDIGIVLILLVFVFLGIKKGMISCIIDILAVVVALVLALVLCRPVTNIVIENTEFDESIKETIINSIPLSDTDFKVEEGSNLPTPIVEYINKITSDVNTSKDDAIETIGNELSTEIITVAVFAIIFIVVRLALVIIKFVSKIIEKIPGLREANKIGGAVCGAIEGVIFIYVVLAVLSMISPMIANTGIIQYVYNSHLGALMYNNNFVLKSIIK